MTKYLIRVPDDLLFQMISVERILEYVLDKSSNSDEREVAVTTITDDLWPMSGAVNLKNLEFRYKSGSKPVINKLSLDVEAHKKIGIM